MTSFPTPRGFRINFFVEIFLIMGTYFHPLHINNCDSNARLVLDEDDNCKFRLKRVKGYLINNKPDISVNFKSVSEVKIIVDKYSRPIFDDIFVKLINP